MDLGQIIGLAILVCVFGWVMIKVIQVNSMR